MTFNTPLMAYDYQYQQLRNQIKRQEYQQQYNNNVRQMNQSVQRQNESNQRIHEQTNYQRDYTVPKAPKTWDYNN